MMIKVTLLALLATCGIALAHTHPGNTWTYDPECCHNEDCRPVPDEAVKEILGGYQVTILPGSHMMRPVGSSPVIVFIPYGDSRIRVSGDEHKHACVSRGGYVHCVYVPPGGV